VRFIKFNFKLICTFQQLEEKLETKVMLDQLMQTNRNNTLTILRKQEEVQSNIQQKIAEQQQQVIFFEIFSCKVCLMEKEADLRLSKVKESFQSIPKWLNFLAKNSMVVEKWFLNSFIFFKIINLSKN
jgi:uncharacterized membrane protein